MEIQNPFLSSSTNESSDVEKEEISSAETVVQEDILEEETLETQLISEELTTVTDVPITTPNDSRGSTPQEDDFVQITEHFESRTEEIQDVITPIEISKIECEPTNQDPEVSDLNDDPRNSQPSESEAEDQISKQEEKPQTVLSIPDGNEYLFGA